MQVIAASDLASKPFITQSRSSRKVEERHDGRVIQEFFPKMNISSRKSCITDLFFQIPQEFIFRCLLSPCPYFNLHGHFIYLKN